MSRFLGHLQGCFFGSCPHFLRGSGHPHRRVLPAQFVREHGLVFTEHLPAGADENGAVPKKGIASGAGGHVNVAGNYEYVPSLLGGQPGGNESTAAFGRFHHQHAITQAADDPVPLGKRPFCRRGSGGKLAQNAAVPLHVPEQGSIGGRIDDVRTAAQNPYGFTAGGESPGHGRTVNAKGKTRHHNAAAFADLIAQPFGGGEAVGRGLPGAYDANGGIGIKFRQPTLIIEHHRRVWDIFQPGRIPCVLIGQKVQLLPVADLQNFLGGSEVFVQQSLQRLPGQLGKTAQSGLVGVEDILRIAEMLHEHRFQPVAHTGAVGKPYPVCQHLSSPDFSLFYCFICHMTMAEAMAAFRDSQWGFMGITSSASALSRISCRTP